ncbi:MAG: hypothetical protein M1820_005554 [Bogoriella megaspora]|nr:MAG: hypothetical protein M1820_005554 [Bogoriella megaspora]
MIVRESPNAKESPSKNQTAWPPRSPYHALLSSPSGKRKLERRRADLSPSPSPMKRASSGTNASAHSSFSRHLDVQSEEDEDEETLQLELQAIEARLKLKRLQQAKSRQRETNDDQIATLRPTPSTLQRGQTPPAQSDSKLLGVEVPLSPSTERIVHKATTSPARVMLGIDKGLSAHNVSLKRASSSSNRQSPVSRSVSQASSTQPKKSFSERIAESRTSDRDRRVRQDQLQRSRSQGFGLSNHRSTQESRASSMQSARGGCFENLPKSRSFQDPTSRSSSTQQPPNDSESEKNVQNPVRSGQNQVDVDARQDGTHRNNKALRRKAPETDSENGLRETPNVEDTSGFEPHSSLHLSKRLIPHSDLIRALQEKDVFPIPRLLKTVKSPNYDPPDIDGDCSDYVILAVIASKSTPYNHRQHRKATSNGDPDEEARHKFMVLRLTDFKWEIDLYLFDSGFESFWKLTVGTVVAILNPGIMPPKNRDTGAFSLKVTSSEDTILEVGMARDLGFCKSVKKDGKECGAWIDKRKTEICEFHVSVLLDKTKAGRMEVNGMAGFGNGKSKDKDNPWRQKYSGRTDFGSYKQSKELKKKNTGEIHDSFLHETMYIAPSAGNTARLLDADDANERRDKAEIQRKRKADIQKENELARRLAKSGSSAGKEYLQSRQAETVKENLPNSQAISSSGTLDTADAASLGLLKNRAMDMHLSPVKRGRTLAKNAEPMGWGGAFKRGLLDQKPNPSPERDKSPSKKKARFMLDDGIRQPGRDSLGAREQSKRLNVMNDDDDDDGLEIV